MMVMRRSSQSSKRNMTSLCIENDLGPWRKEWLLTIVHLCEMYDIAI